MVTIEEVAKRIKSGAEKYGWSNNDYDWKPKTLTYYDVPEFCIKESNVAGAKKKREDKLGKILAFVDHIKYMRSNTYCTVMPISVNSRALLSIWGSHQNVSRAIDYMIEMGLLESEDEAYRFSGKKRKENRSKTYKYFKENEDKLMEYCKLNNIDKFIAVNYKDVSGNIGAVKEVNPKDVKFSSVLKLEKPDKCSEASFENYLLQCLYDNYPGFKFYQQLADDINRLYYSEYPELKVKFKPTFTWDAKKTYVKGIGIRATNSLCNIRKEERIELKREYGFTLEKDVKSSVPRITLSLNSGEWIDESVDIYKLIFNEFGESGGFTEEKREAIKNLHMRAYFDSSDKQLGKHTWLAMDKEGVQKDEVYELLNKLRQALLRAEGGRVYGNEIFFIESCVYLNTLYDLLSSGRQVWEVYDCFYSSGTETQEEFEKLVRDMVKKNFKYYYENWFKKDNYIN